MNCQGWQGGCAREKGGLPDLTGLIDALHATSEDNEPFFIICQVLSSRMCILGQGWPRLVASGQHTLTAHVHPDFTCVM